MDAASAPARYASRFASFVRSITLVQLNVVRREYRPYSRRVPEIAVNR
jgi:hypothetical protein